jgi:hypothetical protein
MRVDISRVSWGIAIVVVVVQTAVMCARLEGARCMQAGSVIILQSRIPVLGPAVTRQPAPAHRDYIDQHNVLTHRML